MLVGANINEKRLYPRALADTEVWLGQDGIFTKTQRMLGDLCEGGAFVETPEGYGIGSVLSLRFMLPGSRYLISCAAAVRNLRNGVGLGVQFLDISEDDRLLVAAFVREARSLQES